MIFLIKQTKDVNGKKKVMKKREKAEGKPIQRKKKEKQQSIMEKLFARMLREGLIISLIVLGIFSLIALYSYHPEDPSFSFLGGQHQVMNSGGRAGAWLSSFLFLSLGYVAYLVPWVSFLGAFGLLNKKTSLGFHGALMIVRGIGAFLLLISVTGWVTLRFGTASPFRSSTGGLIGQMTTEVLLVWLTPLSASLILVAFFLLGLTLSTPVSWVKMADRLGERIVYFTSWFLQEFKKRLVVYAKEWARAKTEHRLQEKQTQKVTKPEPSFSLLGFKGSVTTAEKKPEKKIPLEQAFSVNLKAVGEVLSLPKPAPIRIDKPIAAKRVKPVGEMLEMSDALPSLSLLDISEETERRGYSEEALQHMSVLLEEKLQDFGIEAKVTGVLPGPVVTRFEIQPAAGVKASRITNLAKDLARSLAVVSVRVVEVIPGRTVMGIEIPNQEREIIRLGEIICSREYEQSKSALTLCLGKDIAGTPIVADLAKMPHLLVAGTTGSGKSVGVNAMLLSMIYKSTPEMLRLILIDPKMLELSIYHDIPHLLTPVVTDMKDAANALRWCVAEMERRYRLMSSLGVRNLVGYNRKVKDAEKDGKPITDPLWRPASPAEFGTAPLLDALPFIVVVIDEFADMMMIVGKKVEELIARIAQKARAAGIHLLLATQRPSVDVITGLIKANIPTRVSFQVSSKIDSRTILDQGGAEQLLGHGDMLYLPPGTGLPMRVHGAFVSDEEVHRVCNDWRARSEPNYLEEVIDGPASGAGFYGAEGGAEDDPEADELYDDAVQFIIEARKVSVSSVQRRFKIGYNRAARLVEAMEMSGLVSAMQSNGSRELLVPPSELRSG